MDTVVDTNIRGATASRPYHHGDLRHALLVAARTILEEEQPQSLSLRAIARKAGVSHAAPYRHFSSQEAILAAVAKDGFEELLGIVADIARTPTRAERVGALCQAYMAFVTAHPALGRVMFGPQIVDREPYADLRAAADAVGAEIGRLFEDSTLGMAVWATLHGISALVLTGVCGLGSTTDDPVRLASAAQTLVGRLTLARAA